MDVELTPDQLLLRGATERFIETVCPVSVVREWAADHTTPPEGYRRQAADLGWFAMLVPEEFGGGSVSANGVADAAVIANARGRGLQPCAFAATSAVAAGLTQSGAHDLGRSALPAIATGEAAVTWALAGTDGDWSPHAGVQAEPKGGSFVLNGAKGFVQDADRCDWILVTTACEVGLSQFLLPQGTPGVVISQLDGLDLTRSFSEVRFDEVDVEASALVGAFGDASWLVEHQLHVALVLTLAETVGSMERIFELGVEYAKSRTAFGRPIGSFQAVKHLLADTGLLLETSSAVIDDAVRAVGEGREDAAEVASMAKAFVSDSSIDLAQNCLQVFGGIGYTWEHDLHLYLRRLTTDAALYGDAAWHRERLCQLADV